MCPPRTYNARTGQFSMPSCTYTIVYIPRPDKCKWVSPNKRRSEETGGAPRNPTRLPSFRDGSNGRFLDPDYDDPGERDFREWEQEYDRCLEEAGDDVEEYHLCS